MNKLFLLTAFVSLAAVAGQDSVDPVSTNREAVSPAELTSAFSLALSHFKGWIERPNQNGDPQWVQHLAQLSNYSFTVRRDSSSVIVEIGLLPLKDGSSFRGGGAVYVVDSATGKILHFWPQK